MGIKAEKERVEEVMARIKQPVVLNDADVVVPDDLVLTVVLSNGFMIMGKRVNDGVEDKILSPRVITQLAGGKQINLSGLPGIPSELGLEGESFLFYTVPQWNISLYHLWCKVTDPRVDPSDERFGQKNL